MSRRPETVIIITTAVAGIVLVGRGLEVLPVWVGLFWLVYPFLLMLAILGDLGK